LLGANGKSATLFISEAQPPFADLLAENAPVVHTSGSPRFLPAPSLVSTFLSISMLTCEARLDHSVENFECLEDQSMIVLGQVRALHGFLSMGVSSGE